jgi:hypothetical protein
LVASLTFKPKPITAVRFGMFAASSRTGSRGRLIVPDPG